MEALKIRYRARLRQLPYQRTTRGCIGPFWRYWPSFCTPTRDVKNFSAWFEADLGGTRILWHNRPGHGYLLESDDSMDYWVRGQTMACWGPKIYWVEVDDA
jgi:hypothetical protein